MNDLLSVIHEEACISFDYGGDYKSIISKELALFSGHCMEERNTAADCTAPRASHPFEACLHGCRVEQIDILRFFMMFTIIKFWVRLRRPNVDGVCVAPGTTIQLFHSYNVYWYAVVHEAAAHNLAMEQMCLLSNINKHSKGLPYEAAFWPLHLKGVSYKVKHERGQRLIYKSISFCDPMESFFSFADSLQTWYHMQDLVHLTRELSLCLETEGWLFHKSKKRLKHLRNACSRIMVNGESGRQNHTQVKLLMHHTTRLPKRQGGLYLTPGIALPNKSRNQISRTCDKKLRLSRCI